MEKIDNCGECEFMKIHKDKVIDYAFASCSKQGNVAVPHFSEKIERGKVEIKFHRIPFECPREEGVKKSGNTAAKIKHTVIVNINEKEVK